MTVLAKQARAIARQWVVENSPSIHGFYGAFFHGSINWLDEEDTLPVASDVDVMIVLDGFLPDKIGKFRYQDVLLEISYLPREQVQSAEVILSAHHLAPSFSAASIILDPTGHLTMIQAVVSREYVKRQWVYRRCEPARNKVLRYAEAVQTNEPFHDQAIKWLFATGITTHILLVAGLKNPTVRKRYVTVRDLLATYCYLDFQETLLDLLGCRNMSRAQVEQYLTPLANIFDATQAVIKSPYPFASDLSVESRPIALDGTQALIEQGDHREAVFWIGVTYARCMIVLYREAPTLYQQFEPGFRRLMSDLGMKSPADILRRCEQITTRLPDVWRVAEAIIDANPEITE